MGDMTDISLGRRLVYALASVALWWLCYSALEWSFDVLDFIPYYGTGGIFAALVLCPYLSKATPHRGWRALVLILASSACYWCSVQFATRSHETLGFIGATAVAGAAAALFVHLATNFIARLRILAPHLLLLTAAGGAAGGALVGVSLEYNLGIAVNQASFLLPGHLAWQLLTCLTLHHAYSSTVRHDLT